VAAVVVHRSDLSEGWWLGFLCFFSRKLMLLLKSTTHAAGSTTEKTSFSFGVALFKPHYARFSLLKALSNDRN
jgi:hypothetical protein